MKMIRTGLRSCLAMILVIFSVSLAHAADPDAVNKAQTKLSKARSELQTAEEAKKAADEKYEEAKRARATAHDKNNKECLSNPNKDAEKCRELEDKDTASIVEEEKAQRSKNDAQRTVDIKKEKVADAEKELEEARK